MSAKSLGMTVERLRSVVDYNSDTGKFTWKYRVDVERAWNMKHVGKETGCKNHSDRLTYLVVRIDDVLYRAHRLAWLWVYGRWPEGFIDHRDGDGTNNQIANLREGSNQRNAMNQARRYDSTSGVTGVSWSKAAEKWMAYVYLDGGRKYLGIFSDFSVAADAAKRARAEMGFSPTHGLPREVRAALGPSQGVPRTP